MFFSSRVSPEKDCCRWQALSGASHLAYWLANLIYAVALESRVAPNRNHGIAPKIQQGGWTNSTHQLRWIKPWKKPLDRLRLGVVHPRYPENMYLGFLERSDGFVPYPSKSLASSKGSNKPSCAIDPPKPVRVSGAYPFWGSKGLLVPLVSSPNEDKPAYASDMKLHIRASKTGRKSL